MLNRKSFIQSSVLFIGSLVFTPISALSGLSGKSVNPYHNRDLWWRSRIILPDRFCGTIVYSPNLFNVDLKEKNLCSYFDNGKELFSVMGEGEVAWLSSINDEG